MLVDDENIADFHIEHISGDTIRLERTDKMRMAHGWLMFFAANFSIILGISLAQMYISSTLPGNVFLRVHSYLGKVGLVAIFVYGLCALVQMLIAFFGREDWRASPNLLEHRHQLYGFQRTKRLTNRVLILKRNKSDKASGKDQEWPPTLVAATNIYPYFDTYLIKGSNHRDELRKLGAVLSQYTELHLREERKVDE